MAIELTLPLDRSRVWNAQLEMGYFPTNMFSRINFLT